MYKKILSIFVLCLVTIPAQAGIINLKAGADIWRTSNDGGFSSNGLNPQSYNYSDDTQYDAWVSFEHFVPIIPNVKVKLSQINSDSDISKAKLDHSDFTAYYKVFSNSMFFIDVGATYRLFNGVLTSPGNNKDLDDGVLMGYLNGSVYLTESAFVFAETNIGLTESQIFDYSLGLGWKFEIPVVAMALKTGYKTFNLKANDFSDMNIDLETKGLFVGVELIF